MELSVPPTISKLQLGVHCPLGAFWDHTYHRGAESGTESLICFLQGLLLIVRESKNTVSVLDMHSALFRNLGWRKNAIKLSKSNSFFFSFNLNQLLPHLLCMGLKLKVKDVTRKKKR